MDETMSMIAMWEMGRTRLQPLLADLVDDALDRRVHPHSNSVGWLLRHIGEVEQLFAKNVFGLPIQVKAHTLAGGLARESHGSARELIAYLEESANRLREAILMQEVSSWGSPVTTAEFGTISKREALARITTHTAYHAGQLSLAIKYGVCPTGRSDSVSLSGE
jgi:uncharacterized damage-inducible protein DinB